jgi:hypothetical protein
LELLHTYQTAPSAEGPQGGKLELVRANCTPVSPPDKGVAALFWPEQAATPASKAIAASTAWIRLQRRILVVVGLMSFLHSSI